ncbi:MAG: amino acid adenylation domain-containing protein [Pirellulaceae bacterium]|nr:amino acid adenylation domain-containing protein [Pirellulaceae bacterium]
MIEYLSLGELFRAQASSYPDRIAVVLGDEERSYAQLDRESDQFAARLVQQGVGAGDQVALLVPRSIQFMIAMLGILKAGAVCVPVPTSLPKGRLSQVLSATKVTIVLRFSHFNFEYATAQHLLVDELGRADEYEAVPLPRVAGNAIAFVLFTSGSTGRPKPTVIRHHSVVGLFAEPACGRFDREQVFLHHTSCGWDAMLLEVFGPLLYGGTCVLYPHERLDMNDLPDLVGHKSVNSLWLSAPLFHAVVEESIGNLDGLQQVFTGGDVVRPEIVRTAQSEYPNLLIINGYGPVECVVFSTAFRVPKNVPDHWRDLPIGRPFGDRRCYLLDPQLSRVPIGIGGDVHVGGQAVSAGYWGRPGETAEAFLPDLNSPLPGQRMYRTGDRGIVDREGLLHFGGRRDSQVKISGQRLELGEVEQAILRCPEVSTAAVIALRERDEVELHTFCVRKSQSMVDEQCSQRLTDFLREQLPPFMVPTKVTWLESMPLTATGKVDRERLQTLSSSGFQTSENHAFESPSGESERWLAETVRDLLELDQIPSMGNSFLAAGGTSLSSIRLVARIQQHFRKRISLVQVLGLNTLRQLADLIDYAQVVGTIPAIRRVGIEQNGLPLTPSQRAIWFFQNLFPSSSAYSISCRVNVHGKLCATALQRAIDELVSRHDVLRMQFVSQPGGPVQRTRGNVDAQITEYDLTQVTDANLDQCLEELAGNICRKPLPLDSRVFSIARLKVSAQFSQLILVVHHLVCDGWSVGILLREFLQLHEDLVRGRIVTLPPPPYQFCDYVLWEKEYSDVNSERWQRFWETQLKEVRAVRLPYTFTRSNADTENASQIPIRLSEELSGQLRHLAKSSHANVFATLLTAFQLLLSRVTGQSDVIVGVPTANRPLPVWEHVVGMMVSTIPIRTQVDWRESTRQHVCRVQSRLLDCIDHAGLAVEQLLEAAGLTRTTDWNPLFRVMFSLTEFEKPALPRPEIQVELVPGKRVHAQVDLVLDLNFDGVRVEGILEYDKTLFDPAVCERLAKQFVAVCEQMVEHPDQVVERIDLGGPRISCATMDSRAPSLIEQFEDQVRTRPNAVAVRGIDSNTSYAQLSKMIGQLADQLIGCNVTRGLIIVCYMRRSLAHTCACLAVPKIQAVLMPLDPSHCDESRLEAVCQRAGVFAILRQKEDGQIEIVPRQFEQVSATQRIETEGRTPMYVIHTSGSTGYPKDVVVGAAGLALRAIWAKGEFRVGPQDRIGAVASPAFDASLSETYNALCSGASLCIPEGHKLTNPAAFIQWLIDNDVTILEGTPTWWQFLSLQDKLKEASKLRLIICGGEELSSTLLQKLRATTAEIVNLYGPTETSIDATCWRATDQEKLALVPIGRPLPHARAVVFGRALNPSSIGEVGEFCVAGHGVALGYLGRNRDTACSFIPDCVSGLAGARMFKSGDLVRQIDDENLVWLGRTDHQLKIRGFRIEPGEIEYCLCEHALVDQATVISQDMGLVALVVVSDPTSPAIEGVLKAWCGERLQGYLVPNRIVPVSELPTTAGGKPDRIAMAEIVARRGSSIPFVAPQGETERRVAKLWTELLEVGSIGRNDNFFQLGGHSLLAGLLMTQLAEYHGTHPMTTLFERPVLADFCDWLDSQHVASEEAILPRPAGLPNAPVSLAQKRIWFVQKFASESRIFHLAFAARIRGEVQVQEIEGIGQALSGRHEILRTTFPEVDGRPHQKVHGQLAIDFQHQTMDDDRNVEAWLDSVVGLAFDLQNGPLIRLRLASLGEHDHVIAVVVHHIIVDDWSIGLLVEQSFLAYLSRLAGEPLVTQPTQIHYADYAAWEQKRLEEHDSRNDLERWSERYLPLPPALQFVPLKDRLGAPALATQQYSFKLSDPAVGVVRRLTMELEVSPFMVLLGVASGVMAMSNTQPEFCVGTTVSNRDRVELLNVVGPLVNLVPIPLEIRKHDTWRAYLLRCKERFVRVLSFQQLPFEAMVERAKPDRDSSRHPLFNIMITLQADLSEFVLPGLSIEPLPIARGESFLDASLAFSDNGTAIRGTWQFRSSVVDPKLVRHLSNQIESVLQDQLVFSAGAMSLPVSNSDLETANGLPWFISPGRQFSNHWVVDPPTQKDPIWERIAFQSSTNPNGIAIDLLNKRLTYREFADRVDRLTDTLQHMGLGDGDLVIVHLGRCFDALIVLLSIWRLGAVAVPMDPAQPTDRKRKLIELIQPEWCLTSTDNVWRPTGAQISEQPVNGRLRIVHWDDVHSRGALAFDDTAAPLAYIMFTSGSTGIPKAVVVSKRSLINLVESLNRRLGLGHEERFLWLTALSFDISLFEVLGPLFCGATLIVAPADAEKVPNLLMQTIEDRRPTVLQATPTSWEILFQANWKPNSRQVLISGGEPLTKRLAKQLSQGSRRAWNVYGPTETTIWSSYAEIADDLEAVSIGGPICQTMLSVLDHQLRTVGQYCVGELYISGIGVAEGYLHDSAKTASVFLPDPFSPIPGTRMYRTGDQVCRDGSRQLRFLGRRDGQIKLRGHRIELGEIESQLLGLSEVSAAAVIRSPNRSTGELQAYIVTQDLALSAEQLRVRLRQSLPQVMVPTRFFRVDDLPRTTNGKLDRQGIRSMRSTPLPESSESNGTLSEKPRFRSKTESTIGAIWCELLSTSVSRDTDFFDAGGDSFLAIQALSRIEHALFRQVTVSQFMQRTVLHALAHFIDRHGQEASAIIKLNDVRDGVTLICLPPAGGSALCYAALARKIDRPVYGLHNEGIDPEFGEPQSLVAFYRDAILSVVERGQPIILLGWSLGGIIAANLACEFKRTGALLVEQVVLIDVPSIASVAKVAADRNGLLNSFVFEYLASISATTIRSPNWSLDRSGEESVIRRIWKRIGNDYPDLALLPLSEFESLWKRFAWNLKAVSQLSLELDPQNTLLVDARQEPPREMARHSIPADQRQTEWIDGTHYSILREDLNDLLEILRQRKVIS